MHVLLFDIDGTLIDSRGAGKAALRMAMAEGFGVADPGEVALHGCTDRGIAKTLFELHDVEYCEANFARFRDSYLGHLHGTLTQRAGIVLDGIRDLVASLVPRADVALGLLTGNVRAGAQMKLEFFELFHYFAFGGFGDVHPDRDDVAREAWVEVQRHLNGQAHTDRVWVIGDTPADIKCARAIRARAVAVATGGYTTSDLVQSNPDHLFENLSDPQGLLDLLG